jgi:hypothetical protein
VQDELAIAPFADPERRRVVVVKRALRHPATLEPQHLEAANG